MTAINFDTAANPIAIQEAKVWTRASWGDSWTARADLIPIDVQWVLAPETNTATLLKKYGHVKVPGGTSYGTVTPETTRGYFVLIEIPADDPMSSAAWYWLGYAESPINRETHPARDSYPIAGEQIIPCFGMDGILKQTWIDTTVHVNADTPTELKRSEGAATFNATERGNRHTAKLTLTVGSDESDDAYGFGEPHEDLDRWSTFDIIEHIAVFHLPTAGGIVETGGVPFAITGANALPTWDAPRIATAGRSVYDILDELISADRLLSWTIGAVGSAGDPPTISAVEIHIETALSSALTIPSFASLRANTNVHTIAATTDPLTQVTVIEDDAYVVDQLIIQGPRELAVGTFTLTSDGAAAGELEKAWTTTHYDDYEDGADGIVTGWSSKQQYNQRSDNDRIRGEYPLRDVFRKFKLFQQWDGTVGGTDKFLFEPFDNGVDPPEAYIPYLGSCRFMRMLPLYNEIDYSGDPTAVDESAGREILPPLVAIEDPIDSVIRSVDQINRLRAGANLKHTHMQFGIQLRVANDTVPAIEIDIVNGAPHAIAGSGFVGNVADVPHEHWGGWDYETIQATLAMESPRRSFIATPATLSGADVYRRKFITIEAESLRRVRIAEDTIVGFDDDLTPKLSSGGVLRDPTDELTGLATMFGEFFLNTRKRVLIKTGRRPLQLAIGDMIQSITPFGTVNAQVRSIRVAIPLEGDGTPFTEIVAASAIFDPMQLFVGEAAKKPSLPNKRDRVLAKREARKAANFAARDAQFVENFADFNRQFIIGDS